MKLNRLQLYALSWAMPQTHLAKWVDRSSALIYLVARQFNVPRPAHGHWSTVRAGWPVVRQPLPDPHDLRETSLTIDDRFEHDVNLLSMQALTLGSGVPLQCPPSMRLVGGALPQAPSVQSPESPESPESPQSSESGGHPVSTQAVESVRAGSQRARVPTAPCHAARSAAPFTAAEGRRSGDLSERIGVPAAATSNLSASPAPAGDSCTCGAATHALPTAWTSHDCEAHDAAAPELRLSEHAAAFARWESHRRFLDALEARAQTLSSPAKERLMIVALQARLTLAPADPLAQVVTKVVAEASNPSEMSGEDRPG